jgi:hypothetical protein
MCPFCLATAALLAVGTASTGGLTAFAMNKYFQARSNTKRNNSELKAKENLS